MCVLCKCKASRMWRIFSWMEVSKFSLGQTMVSGRSETQPFHSSSEKTCNFSLVRIIPQTRTRNILWIGQLSFRWNGFYSKVNPMANFGVTYWFGQERKWVTSLLLSSGCHQIKFPGVWLYPLISRSGCTSKELHPVLTLESGINRWPWHMRRISIFKRAKPTTESALSVMLVLSQEQSSPVDD